jgi:hypothetical protein
MPGDDLALAVDVLLVHDRPLRLADALLDDLLRRLGGDAAEVVRRDVRAHDLLGRYLRPVELEVVVGDEACAGRSPVSSSSCSSSAMRASRASSTSRVSMSSGISIP